MMTRVEKYKAVFSEAPRSVPARDYVDGPLLGNGDMGVVIGGKPESQQFWLSKCDFWRTMPRYPLFTPVNIGWLDVTIPALRGAPYYAEQVLASAEVRQTFATDGGSVGVTSWTPATENFLIIELSRSGAPIDVEITLRTREAELATAQAGAADDTLYLTRLFSGEALDWPNEAAVAAKAVGGQEQPTWGSALPGLQSDGQPVISGPAQRFTLAEETPRVIAVAVSTSHQDTAPLQDARCRVEALDAAKLNALRTAHLDWWRRFWSESEISIGDEFLELFYYGSFYIMACSSRNSDFAPAISGVWTPTDHPHWGADYHMNYNHQAPWWGCYGGNHLSITAPYETPVLQYLERGRYMAEHYLGRKGIFYCVGIGPLGSCSCWEKEHHKWDDDAYDKHFFAGQKSNASWGGVNMVMRWRCYARSRLCRQGLPVSERAGGFLAR